MMSIINKQSILQHTLAKVSLPIQAVESFTKLRLYQYENKGTMAKYNFNIQDALYFRNLFSQIGQINICGCESIPGKLVPPTCEITMEKPLIDCLIEYYKRVYADIGFTFYSGVQQQDEQAIFVSSSMIRATALHIADEHLGSQLCHSDLAANVMVAFLDENNDVEFWPASVRYYFKHSIILPQGRTEHTLALVDWYGKHSKKDHFNITRRGLSRILDGVVQNGMRHVELWKPLIRKLTHENIIPIQRIACRFIKKNYHPQNARTDSIAIIPLNRRFLV